MSNVIPNEIKITINTNLPNFSKIKYLPSMTIPETKGKSVRFNPLVKLNQSIINKIPSNFRVKEFFDKQLFLSLINSHGIQRAFNLEQATNRRYIDNNIKITLKNLFPEKGYIYLNNEPYIIGDLNWREGDWKLDVKDDIPQNNYNISTILNYPNYSSYQNNPNYVRSNTYPMNPSILNAIKQLDTLPKNVVQGENYIPMATTITPIVTPSAPAVTQVTPTVTNVKPVTPASTVTPTPLVRPSLPLPSVTPNIKPVRPALPAPALPAPAVTPITPVLPALPTIPTPTVYPAIMPPPQSVSPDIRPTSTVYPAIMPPSPPKPPKPPKQITNPDSNNSPSDSVTLSPSPANTKTLRNFFKSDKFYKLLNSIFVNLDESDKENVKYIFNTQTTTQVEKAKNLSKTAYTNIVDSLSVKSNQDQGDFFMAVADGINFHNNQNPDNKILYNDYGIGSNLFTVAILRNITYQYIISLPQNEQQVFLDKINTNGPSEVITQQNMKEYIESSNYQGDHLSIVSMTAILKLNIITLNEEVENGRNLLKTIFGVDDKSKKTLDEWNKYLFLYNKRERFELLTFNFESTPQYNSIRKTVTIFEREPPIRNTSSRNITYLPPYYLLFIIYGSSYYNKPVQNKRDFTFLDYTRIFEVINNVVNKIIINTNNCLKTTNSYDRTDFINNFNFYFPNANISQVPNDTNGCNNLQNPQNPQNPQNNRITNINPVLRRSTRKNTNNKPGGGKQSGKQSGSLTKKKRGGYASPIQSFNNQFNMPDPDLCYYITIELMLKKGKEITNSEWRKLKCRGSVNKIKKPFAILTNRRYSILPDYSSITNNNNKTNKYRNNSGGRNKRTKRRR